MSKITFLEAIRQLIQSKDYEQYQFHRGILTSGIDTDISSGEFHMAADFINQVCNELTGDQTLEQSLQYKGMSQKTETISMLVDLISKIDLKGNMGAARFVHECQQLLDLHTKKSEAFSSFVVPGLDEFVDAVDELVNSTNMLSIETSDKTLAEIIKRLKREDRAQAAAMVSKRSAEFINLVNDPTSSFSEVNEAVSSGIVTALSLIELALTDTKTIPVAAPKEQALSQEKTEVAQVDTHTDTPAPDFQTYLPVAFNQVKNLKKGSKEYKAKIKFFNRYISTLTMKEVQDIYRDAAKIVFSGNMEDTDLVHRLLNIR